MKNIAKDAVFMAVAVVRGANPNGDPLGENLPRTDMNRYGVMTDVCQKRKIRNRMQDMGESILYMSSDRADDGFKSISERYDAVKKGVKTNNENEIKAIMCEKWMDVRAFGATLALNKNKNKKKDTDDDDDKNVSIGIRGPVTFRMAHSVQPVNIYSYQIIKSLNNEPNEKKGSDTMGMKHEVEFGVYLIKGAVSHQLAEKTGFTQEDAEVLKKCIVTMFENDESSARPAGTMWIEKLYWLEAEDGRALPAVRKLHECMKVEKNVDGEAKSISDYNISIDIPEGVVCEEYEG